MQAQLPISLRVDVDAEECSRILTRFLKDYLESAGRKKFVLGLSGGLDSAVSAAVAVQAVGASNVHAYVLPEDGTNPLDLDHAAAVARHLGIAASTISVQPFIDAARQALKEPDRMQVANVTSRARMIVLHAEAMRRNALVLGTGNKSELLMGYFTKFGDGGVDVQPLGDLYKTQVRKLAAHLSIPQAVLEKPPSAGLYAGQTDEAEMGIPYDKLDRILLGLELHLPVATIAQVVEVKPEEVQRIENVRKTTQHKRRAPLIPKLGIRSVGLDWRAAVLEG